MRNLEIYTKERRFLSEYFRNGCNAKRAYLKIAPDVTERTAEELGSKLLARVKKKDCWIDILEAAGLDDMRLASSLDALLMAKKTEFYQGVPVAEVEDNSTRIRATELLAELRGRRKHEVSVVSELPQLVMRFPDDTETKDIS